MHHRYFSSVEELEASLGEGPTQLEEGEYEELERKLESTDTSVLLNAIRRYGRLRGFDEVIADAVVIQLSRTQSIGSYPPEFQDPALALQVARNAQDLNVLKARLPKYYREALASLLAGA